MDEEDVRFQKESSKDPEGEFQAQSEDRTIRQSREPPTPLISGSPPVKTSS